MYACCHECIDKYRWFVATILKHAHMLLKLQRVQFTNKIIRQAWRCAACVANKKRFRKKCFKLA